MPIFGMQSRFNPLFQFTLYPTVRSSTLLFHPYLGPLHINTLNLKVNDFLSSISPILSYSQIFAHCISSPPSHLHRSTSSIQPACCTTAHAAKAGTTYSAFTTQPKFYHPHKVYPELLCLEVSALFIELPKHYAPLLMQTSLSIQHYDYFYT